jgi:hypothetical protein
VDKFPALNLPRATFVPDPFVTRDDLLKMLLIDAGFRMSGGTPEPADVQRRAP